MLSGKHYNRPWAGHECLSEALHRLLLENESAELHVTDDLMKLLKECQDKGDCKELVKNLEFTKFAEKYGKLREQYLSGERGKTAQFWMFYIELVELQHKFDYSINVNEFELRLDCWRKLITLCFPANKRNYAPYGSYYARVLENLHVTHPGWRN